MLSWRLIWARSSSGSRRCPPTCRTRNAGPRRSFCRPLALLAYLLNHCTTGPFAPFQQLKMLRPRVVDISVKYSLP